ncbi:MAG: ribosome biogenesis/translation initiation ATPase RLI, partial [Candidatus Thermoplasmatota archaeon]|nr:ribosome biogenesis/translation initiation ATPase RLI [Candidatus Thermoplasmatota archaeon]
DADVYIYDEPSSYLDVKQRMAAGRLIKGLVQENEERSVLVVEHDLAILDFITDVVQVMYGQQTAYGIMALPRGSRTAINAYLQGFLPEENMRIRDESIEFTVHPPRDTLDRAVLCEYGHLEKTYDDGGFHFGTDGGQIRSGEVVGVLGPNGIGKTTLVKMLAGTEEPTVGEVDLDIQVAYKPQYIKADFDGTVQGLFYQAMGADFENSFYQHEVARPFQLEPLLSSDVADLSGGELQRVATALCLGREADLYLLDEPSAFLDVTQRMKAAKALRRVMEKKGASALVVDHDVYFIDLVCDSLMVFDGEPGKRGESHGPMDMRAGMNRFLEQVDITDRRDKVSTRPRVNTPGCTRAREPTTTGVYPYAPTAG